MTEAEFQRAIVDLAGLFDWYTHHTRPAMNRSGRWSTPIIGQPGFVDVVLAHPVAGIMFVELKSDTGRLSPTQADWITLLRTAGGDVRVWRPGDAAEIATVLSHGRVTEWRLT